MINKYMNTIVTATHHVNYANEAIKDKKACDIIDRHVELLVVFKHNYSTNCHGYRTVVHAQCVVK